MRQSPDFWKEQLSRSEGLVQAFRRQLGAVISIWPDGKVSEIGYQREPLLSAHAGCRVQTGSDIRAIASGEIRIGYFTFSSDKA